MRMCAGAKKIVTASEMVVVEEVYIMCVYRGIRGSKRLARYVEY